MNHALIDADSEVAVMAVAEALFNYEARNRDKRFADVTRQTQDRYTDKAAWVLSQAAQAIAS